jgi:hypothetical protein
VPPRSIASISHVAASRPFSSWGWETVLSGGVASCGAVVETDDRELSGDGDAEFGSGLEGGECEHVARREHRGRRGLALEQFL